MKWLRRINIDHAAFFWLAVLCLWLCRDSFNLWWTYDDPYLLNSVVFKSLSDIFFDSKVYQTISIFSFIPLFFFSFKIDYILFGFEPFWFYLHQIFSIFLVSLGLYILGRRMDKRASLVGASLFLFSGPTLAAGHILMLRHYVEGAVYSLGMIICLVYFSDSRRILWFGSILYLFACLSKEVYLPLAIMVPFILSGSWAERLKGGTPFLLMFLVYTVWRFIMLPQAGVGPDMGPEGLTAYWPGWPEFFSGFVDILATIWFLDSNHSLFYCFLGLQFLFFFILAFYCFRMKTSSMAVGSIITTIGCALTIFPRWQSITPENILSLRLTFHLAIILELAFVFVLSKSLKEKRHFSRLVLGFLILLVVVGATFRDDFRNKVIVENVRAHSMNYNFFYEEPQDKTLVVNSNDHHWDDLERLRMHHKNDRPPAVTYKPFDFRSHGQPYYEYRSDQDIFVEVSEEFLSMRDAFLNSLVEDVLFDLKIAVDHGRLSVITDLHGVQGTVHLLLGSHEDIFWGFVPIGQKFSLAMTRKNMDWIVMVMVRLKDGRVSISPCWTINLAEDKFINWKSD